MKIRKVILVPCDKVVVGDSEALPRSIFDKAAAYLRSILRLSSLVYNGEISLYIDLSKVLGAENIFVLGEFRRHLLEPVVPDRCVYPSFHGTCHGTLIQETDVPQVIRQVDAVLVSKRGDSRRDTVIREARKHDVPIAILDYEDHDFNYGATDIRKELCYGFQWKKDFDLYFKSDLPLGYKTDVILPVAPVAVKPENYPFLKEERFFGKEQDIPIFFSGRQRDVYQADRVECTEVVKKWFPNSLVLEHRGWQKYQPPRDYWELLARSQMALCPSGRVWCSQRHTETGLTPSTVLITPKPYVETVGPTLQDGVNAVLYDVEFRNGKYHLSDAGALREKIAYYLDRPGERKRLAEAWALDVQQGHTTFARAQYIIESIEQWSGKA